MQGGPSQLETFDMKPQAPAEIRGPYKPTATSVPGVYINELMPRLAKQSRHYSIVRSMTHTAPIPFAALPQFFDDLRSAVRADNAA
ncbi:MAG: DUF1501 domain-containing protein [Acaryochloridaceae cyanobacterium CSU_5_19]|nr:DUF1501 domain-containing protein [Acaryochloridaceae cyanobacterium CSU_5_19]